MSSTLAAGARDERVRARRRVWLDILDGTLPAVKRSPGPLPPAR
jgi:hypothetical protein